MCTSLREDYESDEDHTSDDVGLNCINQIPSTRLFVVKCFPSESAKKDYWRKSATFHTFAKIRDKNCKVIVNSESLSMQYRPNNSSILD